MHHPPFLVRTGVAAGSAVGTGAAVDGGEESSVGEHGARSAGVRHKPGHPPSAEQCDSARDRSGVHVARTVVSQSTSQLSRRFGPLVAADRTGFHRSQIGHTRFSENGKVRCDLSLARFHHSSALLRITCRTRAFIASQTLRPFLPTVEYGDDLETVTSHSVGNHVRCARHDQFPRPSDSTGTAQIRQLSETLDSIEQCASDSIGGIGIVARDVRAKVRQVLNRSRRPDDGHARGAFPSRLRPQDRSQFATSLCATPRPASSSSIPA